MELTSRGAAVAQVTLSEFEAREEFGTVEALTEEELTDEQPRPLSLLAPISY